LFQAPELFWSVVNHRGRAAPNASVGEELNNPSGFLYDQFLAGAAAAASDPIRRGPGGGCRSSAARPEQERRRTGGSHMNGAAMPEEERRATASSQRSGAARPEEARAGTGSSGRSGAGRHVEERRGTGGGRRTKPHKPDQEQQPTGRTASGRVSHVGASPGRRAGGAVRACALCGRTAERLENGKLRECSGCRSVRYCGKDCQKADWPAHKATCKRLRAALV
jgi:hypothetical protein